MSKVTISGNASGTGVFTIAAPNSNTDRTLVLPDEAGTVLTNDTASNVNFKGGDISFYEDTGTTAKFFWDASAESLGIGTSSPSGTLTVYKDIDSVTVPTAKSDYSIVVDVNGNVSDSYVGGIAFGDSAVSTTQAAILAVDAGGSAATHLAFATGSTGGIAERMRIDSSGRSLFTTTGNNGVLDSSWKFQMRFSGSSDAALFMASEANANATGFIQFNRSSTTAIGSIARNGTADQVNYNTSSDYRMKENVIDLSDAITRVKQLQPKRFSWISQESDTATQDGFIAHEVQSIVPEAVTGTKDEVQIWKEGEELPEGVSVGDNKLDNEGNTIPVYQGIDQSKLVPLLTAALQEAVSKIEALETRIAALEA